jgi:16S rRNA C967 or C1407 C5-methylase (RsmB/RsmF family)
MDASSGFAVHLLDLKPADHLLDLCCAPGTKLVLSRSLIGSTGQGSVTGVDLSRSRLASCRSMVKKYRLSRVRLYANDGRTFDERPRLMEGVVNEDTICKGKPFYSTSEYRKSPSHVDKSRLYDKVIVDAQCTHDGSLKHVQKVTKLERGFITLLSA